jgi:hypothetical protein
MKHLFYLTFFILLSSFAHAQSGSFADYCKAKVLKDSVKMSVMYGNINRGKAYKYHIVTVSQPYSIYKTTYYYPWLEKGLNKEVYRTYAIDKDLGNMLGRRDSFNPYGSRDVRSAIMNTILGSIFK